MALLLALALAPAAAWAGTVSLGIAAASDVGQAQPGEEASVSLGMAVGLDRLPAPDQASSVTLGIAVGYDRTSEESHSIRLDANNGSRADAFKGSVSPARLSVPADAEYDEAFDEGALGSYDKGKPQGVAADALASVSATRPGYAFAGWYWAMTDDRGRPVADPADCDRLVLGEGPVDLSAFEDYDYVRSHAGQTLVAAWELGSSVKILLEKGLTDEAQDVFVWFWPGRGYALTEPATDLELTEGVLVAAPGEVDLAPTGLFHNPPSKGSEYFCGWGYQVQDGTALVDEPLITCDKVYEDGEDAGYAYRFTDEAFGIRYVSPDMGAWTGPVEAGPSDAGNDTTWLALYKVAQIRVSAPFQVTFEKPGGEAYAASDLVRTAADGKPDWIASEAKRFTNLGTDRSVYISGVECADAGASALLRGGRGGAPLFSLYGEAGRPDSDPQRIAFGFVTPEGDDYKAAVSDLLPDTWIELPVKGTDGAEHPVSLYYGLNVRLADFKESAVATGPDGGESYVATLANVKYTYSVVP